MPVEPTESSLYVTHRTQDVVLAAALVDFLEEAVPELEGRILCTAVPGYAEQGANTRKHAFVIALFTGELDATVAADVTRARERGTSVAVLCLRPTDQPERALAKVMRVDLDQRGLAVLMEDAAFAFGALPRMSHSGKSALTELIAAADQARGARALEVRKSVMHVVSNQTARALQPIRHVDDAPSHRHSQPVPRPPLVGALNATEVGVSLSECLYHDVQLSALDAASRARMDQFYVALGGARLSSLGGDDAEQFQRGLDEALERLPPERQYLASWFEAGFQLALSCNLGLNPGGGPISAELGAARNEAWTAFAAAASELRLGPEVVSAVAAELARLLEMPSQYERHRSVALQLLWDAARGYDAARAEARRQRQRAFG